MEDRGLRFANGRFGILQITDMQDTQFTNPDTIALVRGLIETSRPDLIVITGDTVKGYGLYISLAKNRKAAVEKTIRNLMKPVAESGVPFLFAFGNHDAVPPADEEFQWNVYRRYPGFIGRSAPGVDGMGNDCVPVFSSDGKTIPFCLYMLNTHGLRDGAMPPLSADQVAFYREKRDELFASQGEYVPALVFRHIPPLEVYEALERVKRFSTVPYFRGSGRYSSSFFALPEGSRGRNSFMWENCSAPDASGGEMRAFAEKGDVMGVYFGHDHNNSFTVRYGDIDLGYTQGAGFNIYGPGYRRGGRVFDIYEDDPRAYRTFTIEYPMALGSLRLKRPVKDLIYTFSPSSLGQAKRLLAGAGAAGGALLAVKLIKRARKR